MPRIGNKKRVLEIYILIYINMYYNIHLSKGGNDMRVENISGEDYIILEENDKVKITTDDSPSTKYLDIKCTSDGLIIDGSSSLLSSIRGEGMQEKIYVLPFTSSKEILKKCDKWLDMFKSVHDKLRELVLSEEYRKKNITMVLSFNKYFSYSEPQGKKIDLDLMQNGSKIQEVMTISIDQNNESIFQYLFAMIIDYYIRINYANRSIHDYETEHILYSKDKANDGEEPIIAHIENIYNDTGYDYVVRSLIANHNARASSDQLINNLRKNIQDQQVREEFDKGIEQINKPLEYILPQI